MSKIKLNIKVLKLNQDMDQMVFFLKEKYEQLINILNKFLILNFKVRGLET